MSTNAFKHIPPFYAPDSPCANETSLIARTALPVQPSTYLISQQEIGFSEILAGPCKNSPRTCVQFAPEPDHDPILHTLPSATPPTSMTNLSSAQQSFKQPFSTGLIPKPDGEVGRPRRGGYNLEKQLGWNKRDYMELKSFVHSRVDSLLDETMPFSKQTPENIADIKRLTSKQFSRLKVYEDCWPVSDLIRSHLKYTSQKGRQQKIRADALVTRTARAAPTSTSSSATVV